MGEKILKNVIVSLINDDLKHQHTIYGLNILGFRNDNLMLEIAQSIFSMMELNINDRRLDHLMDEYSKRSYKVLEIAVNDSESFGHLALEIYNWLSKEQKKYKKKLHQS